MIEVHDNLNFEEGMILDESTLDPTMYYRFVQDRPQNLARKRVRGFRTVTKEDGVESLVELEPTADGSIRLGDAVLMCCPRGVYNQRQALKQRVVSDRLEATTNRLKDKVANLQRAGLQVRFTDAYNEVGEEID